MPDIWLFHQAETLDDLYEWKAALENALAQAPSAAHVMGQNGIFRNDQTDSVVNSFGQCMLNFMLTFLY